MFYHKFNLVESTGFKVISQLVLDNAKLESDVQKNAELRS
jgi:hypothetical protein